MMSQITKEFEILVRSDGGSTDGNALDCVWHKFNNNNNNNKGKVIPLQARCGSEGG